MDTNPPASPVTLNKDDLLTGAATTTAVGVEEDLASLQVTSLPEGQGDNDEASGQETRQ